MPAVPDGPDWVMLTGEPLPVAEALAWAILPSCGAVVMFCGTVRDHSEGRPGVLRLEYESYEEHARRQLASVAHEARSRWADLGRTALLHRVGTLELSDISVVVAVSAPHRDEAFAAARFCIDTLKATVPIWKREEWASGSAWAVGAASASAASVSDASWAQRNHELSGAPDVAH